MLAENRSDGIRRAPPQTQGTAATLFHPIALAIYPALFLYLTNSDLVSVGALLRASLAMGGVAVLLLLAFRTISRDLATGAVLASLVFLNVAARNFVILRSENATLEGIDAQGREEVAGHEPCFDFLDARARG